MAIISILASMLLPALGKAKEQGLSISCVNNLHQIGLALQMYGDDSNDRLPLSTNNILVPGQGAFNTFSWTQTLEPYYNNTNVLRCRALTDKYNKSGYSYFMGSMPFAVLATDTNTVSPASINMHSLNYPSCFPISGDCNYPSDPINADLNNNDVDTLFALPSPVHLSRVNVLFGDWHVRGYKNYNSADITFSVANPGIPYY